VLNPVWIASLQPVFLNPSMSPAAIQAIVSAAPPGAKFLFLPGTYANVSIVPQPGQLFDGDGQGAILDGGSTTPYAFHSTTATGVTIQGLVIQHYDPPEYNGAVYSYGTNGWVIQNNHITANSTVGITTYSGVQVLNNLIDHNGQEGFSAQGSGVLYQGNEVAFNNPALMYDMTVEAGGGKAYATTSATFQNNYVHDNGGNGIWFDTSNIYATITGNRCINNSAAGIFYEISYDAAITNNTCTSNGMPSSPGGGERLGWFWDAGIQLRRSGALTPASPLIISGNTVSGNYNGITLIENPPTQAPGEYGPCTVQNVLVKNNTVAMTQGVTGLAQDGEGDAVFSQNNHFTGNTYQVGYEGNFAHPDDTYSSGWFGWLDAYTTSLATWQGYGNDTTGSLSQLATVPYRLFPVTSGPSASGVSGSWTLGVSFTVTQPGQHLQGYWWWVADTAQNTAPASFALWISTGTGAGTYVAGSLLTSGTLAAGWNYVPYGTGISLTPGTVYRAVIGVTNGAFTNSFSYTPGYYSSGSDGANGFVNGPLLGYSGSAGVTNVAPYDGQNTYYNAGGDDPTVSYPSGSSGSNYWLDVQVG